MLVVLLFLMVACGENNSGDTVNNNESSSIQKQNGDIVDADNGNGADKGVIEVDKNLFSVEITIPATMIADDDPEQIKAEAEKEDGVSKVTINNDGSLTYKMSKAAHKRMMNEMKENIGKTIEETVSSGDYPSIKEIKANSACTVFTMIVDRESFENSFDGFATLGIGMGSMFYQAFDGANAETIKTTIHFEDSNTGEIFSTAIYPDDLN